MKSIIQLDHITWRREHATILDEVDWTVSQGENWAVLGLNGSGKTTILNMINGYIWPSEGKVQVLGHRFGEVDLRELRKRIGWVSSSLQERLGAGERTQNIVISGKYASIGLYDKPLPEDYEKALRLMQQMGCAHLIDRLYLSCSQGEKQKVLIARALMASPQLLILDEATNGLDFLSREALLSAINRIASEEESPHMLLVTHHIEEILPCFTHALLIRRGRVFAKGRTSDMLSSEVLSEFFETPVEVAWKQGRAWLSLSGEQPKVD